MDTVNKPIIKRDSMELLKGTPVFTDDLAPANCLIVKILRSPHANAIVQEIDTTAALKLADVEAVFTWKDCDQDGERFSNAGQTYPMPSPQDRLVLDRHVRFAGDAVAIVAAYTEEAAEKALRMIKVKYEVLPAVLDFHTAKDNPILVHPEENWKSMGAFYQPDNKRNLVATGEYGDGDVEKVLQECDVVLDRTYHTKAVQQCFMESYRAFATIDAYGRLNVTASTQIIYHCRRIIADALHIPVSKVRVQKPRIGGGFGAKQSVLCEFYPAFVTWKTKKPSKIVFSTKESMTAGSPRHEMDIRVRIGAMKDGHIRAIDMDALSNQGAYGEHGPTTVELACHKSIALYGKLDAWNFHFDVVYTNRQASGAYRGYGATQGIFAVESAVNELADILQMDRIQLREMNITHEGDRMSAYYDEINTSCTLDKCLARVREMIHWDDKYPVRDMGNGKVRSVGIAMAMQGSCISAIDVGSARIKLEDHGSYTLLCGAEDMGQGSDTVLSQIAAEVLQCPVERIVIHSGDTDAAPYNKGAYASATTYVTGKAVEECARNLRHKIITEASKILEIDPEDAEFDGSKVFSASSEKEMTLEELVWCYQCSMPAIELEGYASHCAPTSPPPFQVGAVEIELDKVTGEVKVLEYDTCLDCGTPINPNLVRIQTEGGGMQGVGMALFEDLHYQENGKPHENSLLTYRIPSRLDAPEIHVEFVSSFESSGAFGAKSCGEIVINTPGPAIADAIGNAIGKRFTELPITPEQILEAIEG